MDDVIKMAHGSGGKLTHEVINNIFRKYFSNDILLQGDDSAVLNFEEGKVAFTTDSFVITPIFFKGGDIGKLAICGTVNDLASAGAKPLYISCGFILEEGLPVSDLEKIAESMGKTARDCGVKIVTGDTKVVQKGACDKLFINTSGIGTIAKGVNLSGSNAKDGDSVIITGDIGDHGCSVMVEREKLDIKTKIASDCAPLNKMTEGILGITKNIHVLRDPTRGGIATTLNEIASQSNVGIRIYEEKIKVKPQVRGICEMLGMDPLYMANEGKMIVIAPMSEAEKILQKLREFKEGADSYILGEVTANHPKKVVMNTITGGNRIVDMLTGDQLPRIC